MRDELYFLTRYIPFWSIPILLISLECVYLFWLRKKKKYLTVCLGIAIFSLVATAFYYWAGGPEKSVIEVRKVVRFYFD